MLKRCIASVCLIILIAFPLCAADGKVRIAVLDFDTDALRANWSFGWSYDNLSTAAADNLTTQLVMTKQFSVIERQKLNLVLQEQQLGLSGAVDARTAANVGKLLGVQLIVIGSVEEFGVSGWGGSIPQIGKWKFGSGVGGGMQSGKCVVNARLIDTTTAEIIGAYQAEGNKKFGKGDFAGANFGKNYDSGIVSKVLSEAVEKLAQNISTDSVNIVPSTGIAGSGPTEGKIASVSGEKIYINLSSSDGISAGDRFDVLRPGEEIIDPDTGESLGSEVSNIGSIIVTSVQAKFSIATRESGSGFAAGDIVKKK